MGSNYQSVLEFVISLAGDTYNGLKCFAVYLTMA